MNAISSRHASAAPPPALRPQNFGELDRFAQMAAKSSFVPRDYQNRPDNIMVAVQMGSELGLAPMQSLQNIAVINGRPSIYGDAMLALCRASPLCEDVIESMEGEGEQMVANCIAKRTGKRPVQWAFSVADAKRARLWGKQGPWTEYPQRMLQMRARGFALRDAFPDILRGLISSEEAGDTPRGPTIEGAPEPPAGNPAPAEAEKPKRKERDPGDGPAIAREIEQRAVPQNGTKKQSYREWISAFEMDCANAQDQEQAMAIINRPEIMKAMENEGAMPEEIRGRFQRARHAMLDRLWQREGQPELERVEIAGEEYLEAGN